MSETLKIMHNSPVSSHIRPLLDPVQLRGIGRKLKKLVKDNNWEFDAIAFRGNSGAILAGYLSVIFGKPLILVRKEVAHSDRKVETRLPLDKSVNYIIVDDLISSGETVRETFEAVKEMFLAGATCKGILLYQNYGGNYNKHRIHGKEASIEVPILSIYEY